MQSATFGVAATLLLLAASCGAEDSPFVWKGDASAGDGAWAGGSGGAMPAEGGAGSDAAPAGGSAGGGAAGSGAAGEAGSSAAGAAGSPGDPFAQARQQCVDHINQLRATKSREPLLRWNAGEPCADQNATYDSTHSPHADFLQGNTCGASSQNECPGLGPSSVVQCIDMMWAEKDQEICAGCDQCPSVSDGWAGNCPDCKVGSGNPTCGHYLSLLASTYQVACGFSTEGPYTAINVQ